MIVVVVVVVVVAVVVVAVLASAAIAVTGTHPTSYHVMGTGALTEGKAARARNYLP